MSTDFRTIAAEQIMRSCLKLIMEECMRAGVPGIDAPKVVVGVGSLLILTSAASTNDPSKVVAEAADILQSAQGREVVAETRRNILRVLNRKGGIANAR